MKPYFIMMALCMVFVTTFICLNQHHHSKPFRIIEEQQDARGLTSVIYTNGKDTLGLDYLTNYELDNLKNSFGKGYELK